MSKVTSAPVCGATLINQSILVWPGILTPLEVVDRLREMDGPLAVMVGGGGTVTFNERVQDLLVRSLEIHPETCIWQGGEATRIRLDPDAARLLAAWEARDNPQYRWDTLFSQYQRDLQTLLAREWANLLRSYPYPGIYAQVNTDLRLQASVEIDGELYAEVGLNPRDLKRFLKRYAPEAWAEFKRSGNVPLLYLTRYPVADFVGKCRVVLLPDRPAGKIYWSEPLLEGPAGGDEDGDGCATFLPHGWEEGKWLPVREAGPFPAPVLVDGRPFLNELVQSWKPVVEGEIRELVMGMLVKELTGLVTYLFWLFDRQLAVKRAEGRDVKGRVLAFRGSYREVCGLYAPLLERIMDAGKPGKSVGRKELNALAKVLRAYLKGVEKAEDHDRMRDWLHRAFLPFMTEEDLDRFDAMLGEIGVNAQAVRATAVGRLIASGRKPESQARTLEKILIALTEREIQPEDALNLLHDDAFGAEECVLPVPPASGEKAKEPAEDDGLTLDLEYRGQGMAELLEAVRYEGQPVFRNLQLLKNTADGTFLVRALWVPGWAPKSRDGSQRTYRVQFRLPKIEAYGDKGHFRVTYGSPHFYRPVYRFGTEGEPQKVTLKRYLKELLLEANRRLRKRHFPWNSNDRRTEIEEAVGFTIEAHLKGVLEEKLPASSPTYDWVHQYKVVIEVEPQGNLVDDWTVRRRALEWMEAHGFGVGYTSKGQPGSEAAYLDETGFPTYAVQWDPLIKYAQANPKRWAEYQPTDARKLAFPSPFPVKVKGSSRPSVLVEEDGEVTLTVAIGDILGVTVFPSCIDTVSVTPDGVALTALASEVREFVDVDRAEQYRQQVLEQDVPEEWITVETIYRDELPGMQRKFIRVTVSAAFEDEGKLKGIAPFKGAENAIPHRYWTSTGKIIHVLVPRSTAVKKQALSALLLGLLEKAGETEVDPNEPLETLVPRIQAKLRELKLDDQGLETVYWQDEEGRTHELGQLVVINLPFYRPAQTKTSTFSLRDDIAAELHTQLLAGIAPDTSHPEWAAHSDRFAELFRCWQDTHARTQQEASEEDALMAAYYQGQEDY